jgi:hypothetical protein
MNPLEHIPFDVHRNSGERPQQSDKGMFMIAWHVYVSAQNYSAPLIVAHPLVKL